DTILVNGGLDQEENILITKSLSLIGIDNPVIDAQKKHEPVSIEANHVTIKGFTIKNSGHSSIKDIAAIKVYNGRHVSIQNNILDNNFFWIYLQNAKNCHIENNRLKTYGETERLVGNGIDRKST